MKTLAIALLLAAPVAANENVAQIEAARAAYNAAISARDPAGIRAALTDDYNVIVGTSGIVLHGGDATAERFDKTFKDPAFISYVRTPDVIKIASAAERAMERGHWTGRWLRAGSEVYVSGEYLAVWLPTPTGWRLQSETFVTLDSGASGSGPH